MKIKTVKDCINNTQSNRLKDKNVSDRSLSKKLNLETPRDQK